jgi:hypothetical protein
VLDVAYYTFRVVSICRYGSDTADKKDPREFDHKRQVNPEEVGAQKVVINIE